MYVRFLFDVIDLEFWIFQLNKASTHLHVLQRSEMTSFFRERAWARISLRRKQFTGNSYCRPNRCWPTQVYKGLKTEKNLKKGRKTTACKLAKQRKRKRGGPPHNPPSQTKRQKASEPTQIAPTPSRWLRPCNNKRVAKHPPEHHHYGKASVEDDQQEANMTVKHLSE